MKRHWSEIRPPENCLEMLELDEIRRQHIKKLKNKIQEKEQLIIQAKRHLKKLKSQHERLAA